LKFIFKNIFRIIWKIWDKVFIFATAFTIKEWSKVLTRVAKKNLSKRFGRLKKRFYLCNRFSAIKNGGLSREGVARFRIAQRKF